MNSALLITCSRNDKYVSIFVHCLYLLIIAFDVYILSFRCGLVQNEIDVFVMKSIIHDLCNIEKRPSPYIFHFISFYYSVDRGYFQ